MAEIISLPGIYSLERKDIRSLNIQQKGIYSLNIQEKGVDSLKKNKKKKRGGGGRVGGWRETEKNVSGVAGLALLQASGFHGGFEIEIDKRIKPGSGIGSSAASSTGGVWAMNELLGRPFSNLELVQFAMQGEKLASDVAHADNVAPERLEFHPTGANGYDLMDIWINSAVSGEGVEVVWTQL